MFNLSLKIVRTRQNERESWEQGNKVVGFKKIKDEGSVSLLPILSLILIFVFFQKILLLTVPNCSNALRNWKGTKE